MGTLRNLGDRSSSSLGYFEWLRFELGLELLQRFPLAAILTLPIVRKVLELVIQIIVSIGPLTPQRLQRNWGLQLWCGHHVCAPGNR